MAVVFVDVLLVMPAAEAAYKTHSLLIHPSAFSGNTVHCQKPLPQITSTHNFLENKNYRMKSQYVPDAFCTLRNF